MSKLEKLLPASGQWNTHEDVALRQVSVDFA